MRTQFYLLIKGCFVLIQAAFIFSITTPLAMAQGPTDYPWSIPFLGIQDEHEGIASWQADGTGPEPYGFGHQIPIPTFLAMPYYSASRDYDDIDPDPDAAMSHFTADIQGFPSFVEAMDENGYIPAHFRLKSNLGSLGEDELGYDWFIVGDDDDEPHAFYYGYNFYIFLDGEPMISMPFTYCDVFCDYYWQFQSSFCKPDSAWAENTDPSVKAVGRAFLQDVGNEEVRILGVMAFASDFSGNGRIDGMLWDVQGVIERGQPQLPFQGIAADHQGMAGWNADGTGPEPPGDGHGAQRYYVASRDYDDIDPAPNAAFGHFLPEMTGFMNLALQMEYRDYTPDQLLLKNGLSSLGADVMGKDWGFANGTEYWCNYYDVDYVLELNGEQIITGLVDTSLSWMSPDPLYWWCEATLDRPRDGSAFASEDAQIMANAFLKDLESRKMVYDIQQMTYDADTFNSNGRYNGGYFNVVEARMVGKHDNTCCFVQTDTLGTGFSSETHWTMAHSPYFVDNSLFIPEGHTLFIEPGVKVALRGPYNIDVKGNIIAEGTTVQGILFTHSNPLQEWNSLTYDGPLNADSSLFRYCTFEYSHSVKSSPINSGGAIAMEFVDEMEFDHCTFRYNTADRLGYYPPSGGAIAMWTSSPKIDSCIFYGNYAEHGGAIICYLGSNPEISYSLFYNNSVQRDGGAIIIYESCSPNLINNTITGNMAGGAGGGVALYENDSDSVIFINNILYGNQCNPIYNGKQVGLISNNNLASFHYNDIEGGFEGLGPYGNQNIYYASSNIDADPVFCFPEEYIFTLASNSPCLNSGMNGSIIGAFDWGCYNELPEGQTSSKNLNLFPDPVITGMPLTVAFNIESSGPVQLEIFNITGTMVAKPIGGIYAAGDHSLTFSTSDLPAGIYIARLAVNGDCYVARFVIIR